MEFYINKNSTLPVLKMELIKDGRNDFNKFYSKIQDSTITFTMWDSVTGIKRIACKTATIEEVEGLNDCNCQEFLIVYQFTERETSKSGRYIGQFEITFNDNSGNLIAPIKEELFINIMEGSIKK